MSDPTEPKDLLWNALLDSIPVGIATLDSRLNILRRNATATALLRRQDGLLEYNGRLRASTAHHSFALMGAVRKLEQAASRGVQPSPVTLLKVPRRSSDREIEVVLKLVPREQSRAAGAAVVIAYICDPDRAGLRSEQLIASLYHLTPAETKLTVHLLQGHSLEEAADLLSVKKDTVRKHLQSIFSKTRTSRQSDLIRLLMSGIAQLEF